MPPSISIAGGGKSLFLISSASRKFPRHNHSFLSCFQILSLMLNNLFIIFFILLLFILGRVVRSWVKVTDGQEYEI